MIKLRALILALIGGLLLAVPVAAQDSDYPSPWFGDGCEQARILTCTTATTETVPIYVNGLNLGTCAATPITFTSRMLYTDTIVAVGNPVTLGIECLSSVSAAGNPVFTGTLGLSEPETFTATSGQIEVLGGGGFLGIDMGGDLGNPDAPINQWLDIATDFLDVVNSGNLLYIIGAIGGAGAVLAWAISTVRHPETF